MTEYRCPCCDQPGIRAKYRNLRIECYKAERRRACAAYREKKRALLAKPEMRLNETAVAMLVRRITVSMWPCPRRRA